MQKKWLTKALPSQSKIDDLRSLLKVDRVVATLLLQRDLNTFESAQTFFRPNLKDLHNPFLMKDMDNAVDRIEKAFERNEKVLLFGDYDVDGTTAVALMYIILKMNYPSIEYYIPDRYKEGYGISFQGIDFAHENEFSLIISLDCGIKSNDKINYAKEKGIDFIVCDHHNPGTELPDAIVLDPKRNDCSYPYKELSGCGVGFKLLQALTSHFSWNEAFLFQHLDLVAISIGADIVQITGENRILCYHGMEQLNQNPRTSFKVLFEIAKKTFPVSLTDVVFTIAPRINAAGRLRSGKHAVDLMISDNFDEVLRIANEINEDNKERRILDAEITMEALELIENDPLFSERKSTVVHNENWHKGVVGIVASRLIEKHYRPTIVLTTSNGKITGSARTVNDFNIHDALLSCEGLLEQFGGHTHAAGMTLNPENLNAFVSKFESVVAKTILDEELIPNEEIDLELSFDEVFTNEENRMKLPRLKRILNQLEPHGPGNMKPVFISKNVFSVDIRLLKEVHLKLRVTQPNTDIIFDAIGFNMSEKMELVAAGIPFDILYTLETNVWKGKETVQFNLKDIKASKVF